MQIHKEMVSSSLWETWDEGSGFWIIVFTANRAPRNGDLNSSCLLCTPLGYGIFPLQNFRRLKAAMGRRHIFGTEHFGNFPIHALVWDHAYASRLSIVFCFACGKRIAMAWGAHKERKVCFGHGEIPLLRINSKPVIPLGLSSFQEELHTV